MRILEEHDEEVTRRMAELESQRAYIRHKIAWYREVTPCQWAPTTS
jgi:hypothetical protein